MRDFKKFIKGVRLKDNSVGPNAIGDLSGSLTSADDGAVYNYQSRIKAFLDSAEREVVTNDQTQTLENKTVDGTSATGNNTITADADNITYDDTNNVLYTFGTDLQAALDAVKTQLDAQNEASEIDYDNSTSGLTATDVQAAIDEVEGRVDAAETDIADLTTLSGVAANDTDLGTFTGTTISDNVDNKVALQELETAIEGADADVADLVTLSGVAANSTDLGTFTGTTISDNVDNKVALQELETGLEDHEALTAAHGTTGDVVGTTDTQTLTNKTLTTPVIDQINTSTDTNLNLNPDGAGKVVASKALDLSSVVELSSADNAAATGADEEVSLPATGIVRLTNASLESISAIVAGADEQELIIQNATGGLITINDEDTGATAANRIKTGTKGTISLADEASLTLYYDATESRWMVNGGVGGESSAGSVDIYYQNKFEVTTSADLEEGNGTSLSGGAIAGTTGDETSTQIEGAQSLNYTQASGSLNDFFFLPAITIGSRQRGKDNQFLTSTTYDGDSDDIEYIVYDVTNTVVIAKGKVKASTDADRLNILGTIASNCTSLKIGFRVLVENIGAKLVFDLVQASTNPIFIGQSESLTGWISEGAMTIEGVTSDPTLGTVTTNQIYSSQKGKLKRYRYLLNQTTGGIGSGDYLYSLPAGDKFASNVEKITSVISSATDVDWIRYGYGTGKLTNGTTSGDIFIIPYDDTRFRLGYLAYFSSGNVQSSAAFPLSALVQFQVDFEVALENLTAGTDFFVQNQVQSWTDTGVTASSLIDAITTAPTFGTLATDRVLKRTIGDKTRYRYEIEMTSGGTIGSGNYLYSLPNGDSFGSEVNLFSGTLTNAIDTDFAVNGYDAGYFIQVGSVAYKATIVPYDSTRFRVMFTNYTTSGTHGSTFGNYTTSVSLNFDFEVQTQQTSSQQLIIPAVRTMYLRDERSSGVQGGAITAATYNLRILNTIQGDQFGTLSTNQFTLPPGKYNIEGSFQVYAVNRHKLKLRNITDSTDDLFGMSGYTDTTGSNSNNALISGSIEIIEPKTYEIQHYCQSLGGGANSLGFPANIAGENEVYGILKISKVL